MVNFLSEDENIPGFLFHLKGSRKSVCFIHRFLSSNAAIGWSCNSAMRYAKRIFPFEGETQNSSTISQLHQNRVHGCLKCCPHKFQQTILYCYQLNSVPKILPTVFLFSQISATSIHTFYNMNQIHFCFIKTQDSLNILNIVHWHYKNQNQNWLLVYIRNEKR